MENMEQVFEQWQQFEDKRIRFFRELLLEVKQHLDLSTNHRLDTGPYQKKIVSHRGCFFPSHFMSEYINVADEQCCETRLRIQVSPRK